MLCIAKEAPDASHLPNEPIPTAPLVGADDPVRPPPSIFCRTSGRVCRGRCRAQLFATKERYRCGLPLAGTHRPASAILHRAIVFECRGGRLCPPAKAPSASEEACCIPFPPGRRKLHIRSLLLPFQTGTISLGSGLADKWGLSPKATGGVSIFQEKKEGRAKPELQTVPPSRQKKPAPFRFRRGGENSISAAFFFLPKL